MGLAVGASLIAATWLPLEAELDEDPEENPEPRLEANPVLEPAEKAVFDEEVEVRLRLLNIQQ